MKDHDWLILTVNDAMPYAEVAWEKLKEEERQALLRACLAPSVALQGEPDPANYAYYHGA